jgi:putative transposase
MKLTAKEIAERLGKDRSVIVRKAKREGWLFVEEPNPNGGSPIKFYIIESLPEKIKSKILHTAKNYNMHTVHTVSVHAQNVVAKEGFKIKSNDNVQAVCNSVQNENLQLVDSEKDLESGSLVKQGLTNFFGGDKRTNEPKNWLTNELFDDNIWLTVAEVSRYLNKSERTIQKNCKAGRYTTISVLSNKGRGGKELKIALSSLPSDAQVRWVKQNRELAKKLSSAITDKLSAMAILEIEKMRNVISIGSTNLNDEEKEELGKILEMIDEAKKVPFGVSKRAYIEKVAKKYGKGRSTLQRYIKIFRETGLAGLKELVSKKRDKKLMAWDVEAIEFMRGVYLAGVRDGNEISKEKAFEVVSREAKKKGWRVGSIASAYRYLSSINPMLLKFAKGGRQALDNLFYIARSYEDLRPFQVVVGDQHQFDFWVRDTENGEVFRPMGYFFVDAKTRVVYGFALSGRKYNAVTIGLALRMGLSIFGFCESIYTDNGKPEISKYIEGISKDLSSFGTKSKDVIEMYKTEEGYYAIVDDKDEVVDLAETVEDFHRKAKPYNAKAKLVERFFRTFEGVLANLGVPGRVTKNDVAENVKRSDARIKELVEAEKLLTYEEFILKVFEAVWVYNNRKHNSLGCSPIEKLVRCIKNEGFVPVFPAENQEIDKIFFARAKRKVHRGRVQINNVIYEADAELSQDNLEAGLWHLADNTEIEVRYNPFDISVAYAILPDNTERVLTPLTSGSMIDKETTKSLIARKRSMIKAVTQKYKKYISQIPDILEYSKVKSIKREKIENEYVSNEEIRERVKERLDSVNSGISPIKPLRRKIIFSSVERYEDILLREIRGEYLDEIDLDFKCRYEASMSDDKRKRWEFFRKLIAKTSER